MFLKILRQSKAPAISSTTLRSIGNKPILTSFIAKNPLGEGLPMVGMKLSMDWFWKPGKLAKNGQAWEERADRS